MKTNVRAYMKPAVRWLVVILGIVLLTGCGKPYETKSLSPVGAYKKRTQNALNSSKLSLQARQELRIELLDRDFQKTPLEVIEGLDETAADKQSRDLLVARAEAALLEARKAHDKDPDLSFGLYLTAAETAYDYLFSDPSGARMELTDTSNLMRDIYNRSVARCIEIANKRRKGPRQTHNVFTGIDVTYDYELIHEGPGTWDPLIFDQIFPAAFLDIKGVQNHYRTSGIGTPLVCLVVQPHENPHFGKRFPAGGAAFAGTAVVRFGPRQEVDGRIRRKAAISVYDPLVTETVEINGRILPLEIDYTTPFVVLMDKLGLSPDIGLDRMFKTAEYVSRSGISILEPYNPDKIPVVLSHGLMSSPEVWANVFNDLRGDPLIRRHCQLWLFGYPSGLPIVYSAALLREDLYAIQEEFDPDSSNPLFDDMVLVGHSMGGLLTRLMVTDSGTLAWDAVFTTPIDELPLDEEDKRELREMLFFEPVPFVDRAIFISTPHRGSSLADTWYAGLGSGMIHLPKDILALNRRLFGREMRPYINPEMKREIPSSIHGLSQHSPFVKTLAKMEISPEVTYHSIIGIRNFKQGPGSTDGVVPYSSSHLEGAASELWVPSDHGAPKHPMTVHELKRILREHLREAGVTETAGGD